MRFLARCLVVTIALSLAAAPRPAFALCPDDLECDASKTDVTLDGPPVVDVDGQPIPFVEEVDAPPLGIALIDGDPH
jgi:hypothetical protein